MGALMTLHSDYQISEDPLRASIHDLDGCIVNWFEKAVGTKNVLVKHYTFDLGVTSAVETAVQQKIAGHGLEGVGLMEVELEMYLRELEKAQAERLFAAVEAVEEESESEGEEGEKWLGVCPPPMKDL